MWRMGLTRTTVPALGASLVLLVSGCGDDSSGGTDDPGADASASESSQSETPSASESPEAEPVALIDFGREPKVKKRYKSAALRATDDDLITMVPSVLPDGWTTAGGGYRPDPQWWHMEFTAPTGDVTLDQFPGTSKDVLADQDLATSGDVDLSAWGIGTWSAWDRDGATVLTRDLKDSTVVLQGAEQDSVEELAKSLVPAEDSKSTEG
jgi:hypothetical protein